MYDFKKYKAGLAGTEEWLKKEFFSIRTGRATATLLDSVFVEAWGSRMPLNQVATVSMEDARTLKVNPFDAGQASAIEKGINAADLGVSVLVNASGMRVIFPDLTGERRELLVKQAKKKLEEAKVSLRKERDEVWTDIQNKEKAGGMGEDDKFRFKDEMQKYFDETQKKLEKMTVDKEAEIKS